MAGLYIHVPFCRSKCYYCDFYSTTLPELEDLYCRTLKAEMIARHTEVDKFDTVYVGGGTPSTLTPAAVEHIGEILAGRHFDEFTVEVNPDDVTDDLCRTWKAVGANRISMGVQSFNDAELAAVGRRHNAATAARAYETLRRHFDNVSLDLILALPGQTIKTLKISLGRLLGLEPEHFSAYILSYEPRTRLWAKLISGKITETDEDTQTAMYGLLCDMAMRAGYEHYEISNFAKPGRRALHNAAYWADVPYLGLGPAAHSFDGSVRRENPRDLRQWVSLVESKGVACSIENETETDRINDRIMVALRTSDGLDIARIPHPFRNQVLSAARQLGSQRIIFEDGRLVIPEDAWIVSDDTIASLFV